MDEGGRSAHEDSKRVHSGSKESQDHVRSDADGLFKSADAGESWKRVGSELKNLAAVTVNSKNSGDVYVATVDGKIFASADGGLKWKAQK